MSAEQKDKPSDLEKELDKLQTEFDQIENQIRAASPKYAALTASQYPELVVTLYPAFSKPLRRFTVFRL